jgi:hypothetical protein
MLSRSNSLTYLVSRFKTRYWQMSLLVPHIWWLSSKRMKYLKWNKVAFECYAKSMQMGPWQGNSTSFIPSLLVWVNKIFMIW